MSRQGGTIGITIDWNCDLDWKARHCKPVYEFHGLYTEKNLSQGFNFRCLPGPPGPSLFCPQSPQGQQASVPGRGARTPGSSCRPGVDHAGSQQGARPWRPEPLPCSWSPGGPPGQDRLGKLLTSGVRLRVVYSFPGMRPGILPAAPPLLCCGGGLSSGMSKGPCIPEALGTPHLECFSSFHLLPAPPTSLLPQGLPGTSWRMGPTAGIFSRCLGFASTSS